MSGFINYRNDVCTRVKDITAVVRTESVLIENSYILLIYLTSGQTIEVYYDNKEDRDKDYKKTVDKMK